MNRTITNVLLLLILAAVWLAAAKPARAVLAGDAAVSAGATGTKPESGKTPAANPPSSRSLDDRLLEDLGGIAPPSVKPVPKPPSDAPADLPKPSPADAAQPPPKSAPPSSAASDGPDRWQRIARGMQRSGKLLADQNTGDETQSLQRQIAGDLAAILADLEKQCAGQCNKPGGAKPGSSGKPGGQSSGGQPGGNPSPSARVKESVERTGDGQPAAARAAVVEAIRAAAWGNLPERLRAQMQNSASEEFLPEYRESIEEYFRKLAETPPR